MFEVYFPILVLLFFATAVAVTMVVLPRFLGRREITQPKQTPYECGMIPLGDARERFPVKFYLIALVFIVFDLEVVFFYPWAVVYKHLGLFGFVEMLVFVFILLVGYLYIVKKGVLKWE